MSQRDAEKGKSWMKPILTILKRNRPEEAVLTACKGNQAFTAPTLAFGKCRDGFCNACLNFTAT
jgi:hypothetical protein